MANCCNTPARSLVIEVTVLRVEGETCPRCSKTVEAARIAAEELQNDLAGANVRVTLLEHASVEDDLTDSNSVLINGRSVEEWIGADRVITECPACSDMLGEEVSCGAISIEGSIENSFNSEQIREAAFTALGEGSDSGCGCGGAC